MSTSAFYNLNKIISFKQKRSAIILVFLMFVGMVMELIILKNLLVILEYFSNPKVIEENIFFQTLNGYFKNYSGEFILLGFFAFLFFVKSVITIFVSKYESRFLAKTRSELSKTFFEGYLNLPLIFRLKSNTADLAKNITEEVEHVTSSIHSLSILIMEILVLSGITVFLLIYNFELSLIVILLFLSCGILINFMNRRKLIKVGRGRVFHVEKRLKSILEGLSSFKEIRLFGITKKIFDNFNFHNKKIEKIFYTLSFRNSLPKPTFELFIVIIITFGLIMSNFSKNNLSQIVPVIGIFLAAAYRVVPSLSRIFTSLQRFQFNTQALPKLKFDNDMFTSFSKKRKTSEKSQLIFNEKIIMNNVNFSYLGDPKKEQDFILKNLNIEIEKGNKIGIIGESGSGKSTFLDILLGLFSVNSGEVLIDKLNINKVGEQWQKLVGCVPQDIYIYDDTIRNNITLAFDNSQIDVKKVEKIAKIAKLDNLINNLENGLDTIVGERGARLSGGQKQRIGIARALYFDPQVLVFDESTNALDFYNEKNIISELLEFGEDKTIVFVSHKRNIFDNFDKIFEISDKTLLRRK